MSKHGPEWEKSDGTEPPYLLPDDMRITLVDGYGPDLEPARMLGFSFHNPGATEPGRDWLELAVSTDNIDGIIEALRAMKEQLDS